MKARIIKQVIRKKIDEWASSIEDEAVRDMVGKNTIVTGGCIASMLLSEKVNDFDVYFKDRATTCAVAEYYVSRFHPRKASGIPCEIRVDASRDDRISVVIQSAGVASEDGADADYQYFEGRPDEDAGGYIGEVMTDPGEIEDTYERVQEECLEATDGEKSYRPVFMSTNAITLSGRVQIVLRFYGKPDEIHGNYDFVHCTNHWTSWDGELTLKQPALEALLARELRYVGSKYPICSIIRLRKFIQRGWSVNAGQILKMVMQASDLDLKNPEVLQDQLTGVDAAYFTQIMKKLKERDPEKINTAYLIEIIDRMF